MAITPELVHRFRNELGVASGFGDLLVDAIDQDDPRYGDALHVVDAVQRCIDLLPELVRWTRHQSGSYMGSAAIDTTASDYVDAIEFDAELS